MIEVEVFGASTAFGGGDPDVGPVGRGLPAVPPPAEVKRLCVLAAASAGVEDGHLAIEYVDAERIAQLNAEHRGKQGPTDVLSFPLDGANLHGVVAPYDTSAWHGGVPRELGDVVICLEHTIDLREAIVHGVLHLVGMDHETDGGEMLALQAELLSQTAVHPDRDAGDAGP